MFNPLIWGTLVSTCLEPVFFPCSYAFLSITWLEMIKKPNIITYLLKSAAVVNGKMDNCFLSSSLLLGTRKSSVGSLMLLSVEWSRVTGKDSSLWFMPFYCPSLQTQTYFCSFHRNLSYSFPISLFVRNAEPWNWGQRSYLKKWMPHHLNFLQFYLACLLLACPPYTQVLVWRELSWD